MTVTVHSHWTFITNTTDNLFAYGDKVMQAMLDLEKCTPGFADPAVAADAERGVIEIEAEATGNDLSHAIATVHAAVRAALHEAGIGTPDWPTHDEALSMVLKDLHTVQV
jgi:hypothetical protein